MAKFSIIIPLYNCKNYIVEALESALNQDYQDFEVIVINDGSTDGSEKLIEPYLDGGKVRLISQENKGLFHTRLVGLDNAKNDYCLFLDSDDRLELNALSTLNEIIEKENADVVFFRLTRFYEDGTQKSSNQVFDKDGFVDRNEILSLLYRDNKVNSIVLKAFKRGLINTAELQDFPRITVGEDSVFTLKLFENTDKIYYTQKVLYNYRMLYVSMTHSIDKSSYFGGKFIIELFLQSCKKMQLENLESDIYAHFFKKVASTIFYGKYLAKGKKQEYIEMLKSIAEDEFFINAFSQYGKPQKLVVKLPNKLLYKKKFKTLYFLKKIIEGKMLKR